MTDYSKTDNPEPHSNNSRLVSMIILAAIAGLIALQAILFRHWMVDDSFISLRFSRNFAQGHGLIWNTGERVEGYSCFLWVFILGCIGKLGLDIVLMAKVVGLASCIFVMFPLYRIVREHTADPVFALLLPLIIAGNFGYVFFAMTGMECALYSALITSGVVLFARAKMRLTIGSAILFAATALTRPEGLLYLSAFSLIGFVTTLRASESRRTTALLRSILTALIGFGIYGAFLLWRHSYYGEWVPNTFYAKPPGGGLTSGIPIVGSFDDIMRFMFAAGGGLSAFFFIVALAVRDLRKWLWPYMVAVGIGFLFQLYASGDWMDSYRYLVPIFPAYALISVMGLHFCMKSISAFIADRQKIPVMFIAYLVVSIVCFLNLVGAAKMYEDKDKYPNFVLCSQDMISAARWVNQHAHPSWTITCLRIGALGYYSGINLIDDAFGLTDSHVAKLRFRHAWTKPAREAYMEERKPELIMSCWTANVPVPKFLPAGKLNYRFVRSFKQGSEQVWLLYLRSDIPVKELQP